ncbi:LytTR family transcriptional regulator DNA-binding domain-containing protein [Paenibacillus sp. Aloe-11]|uniref:LytTR family transcriptional regulator DNA-binding domain-containing protein n=1 Tax=Paenibacillus sp. Aloe-11 TaxID=1050222 RepID=UPI0005C7452D|nr:LytTR family transcriptional regulator DNA-binding domain-containing protein [Paenibacillus sp. Aloe-11]
MDIIGIKLDNQPGLLTDISTISEFSLHEVNWIDQFRRTAHSAKIPAYHTKDFSFLTLDRLKDLERAYSKFGFKRYDQSIIINEQRVQDKVSIKNGTRIYFVDGSYVIVRSKHNM